MWIDTILLNVYVIIWEDRLVVYIFYEILIDARISTWIAARFGYVYISVSISVQLTNPRNP